jgi:nucleoside 2-deoxyribosyltransferase
MTTDAGPRVYLAGPDVFLADTVQVGTAKKELCARFGMVGVYPGDGAYERLAGLAPPDAGLVAFDICVELMDTCDLALANMTPFRGPSMDVGTAVEIGYMYAQGKPVYGYSNTAGVYADRVAPDGLFIEPFDLCDILMAPGVVARSTGEMPTQVAGLDDQASIDAPAAFAECVRVVAASMGLSPPGRP